MQVHLRQGVLKKAVTAGILISAVMILWIGIGVSRQTGLDTGILFLPGSFESIDGKRHVPDNFGGGSGFIQQNFRIHQHYGSVETMVDRQLNGREWGKSFKNFPGMGKVVFWRGRNGGPFEGYTVDLYPESISPASNLSTHLIRAPEPGEGWTSLSISGPAKEMSPLERLWRRIRRILIP